MRLFLCSVALMTSAGILAGCANEGRPSGVAPMYREGYYDNGPNGYYQTYPYYPSDGYRRVEDGRRYEHDRDGDRGERRPVNDERRSRNLDRGAVGPVNDGHNGTPNSERGAGGPVNDGRRGTGEPEYGEGHDGRHE